MYSVSSFHSRALQAAVVVSACASRVRASVVWIFNSFHYCITLLLASTIFTAAEILSHAELGKQIMESGMSLKYSMNHKDSNSGLSLRPSPSIQRDSTRCKPSTGAKNENQVPISLPTTLNCWLKTTTEAGNIGQFAIKPSSFPLSQKPAATRSDYAMQKSQHTFHLLNGQQKFDDRRRLPSYARDTISETVSLYEIAGQKASSRPQVPETTGHRSYSMTQTSNLSNVLSNHRSYASLRSPPELNLLARPRSPFLYPARLKRLGFRPSSPILIEGGRIDNGQNAELVHAPYATGMGSRLTSSPNSGNQIAQFPLPVQSDIRNVYPSALGPFPLGSRSHSLSLKSMTDSMRDRGLHPETASVKASSTGDNFRYTSTPVKAHRRSLNSFTDDSSKAYASSPLYYDYTEDFNVGYAPPRESAARDNSSPIPSDLDKTIHESTDSTFDTCPKYEPTPQQSFSGVEIHALAQFSSADSLKDLDDKHSRNSDDCQTERSANVTQDIIPLYMDRRSYNRIDNDPLECSNISTSHQLGDDLEGNLQSNNNTNNSPRPIRLEAIDWTKHNLKTSHFAEDKESLDQNAKLERTSGSNRTSSFRISTYLPSFPEPPDRTIILTQNRNSKNHGKKDQATLENGFISVRETQESAIRPLDEGLVYGEKAIDNDIMIGTSHQFPLDQTTGSLQRSATTYDRRIRSSRYYSVDHGLSDLAQLISAFELANGSFASQDLYAKSMETTTPLSAQLSLNLPNTRFPEDSLVLPIEKLLQSSPKMDSRMRMTRFQSDGDLRATSSGVFKDGKFFLHEKFLNLDNDRKENCQAESYHKNFSHAISNGLLSNSEPLMFAPKAVSPVRVLGSKNNVPQLMKSLPPVPRNSIFESSSSLNTSPHHSLSSSPPLDPEPGIISTDIQPISTNGSGFRSVSSQQCLEGLAEVEQIPSPSPKFRIKSRLFYAQRSHTPANSRPRNLDEHYPWHGQQPTIQLSSLPSIIPGSRRATKFKLSNTGASPSPSGTIRINPHARSRPDLRSPKDLFTTSSNLKGIFRQVRRQFSSRSSAALETALGAGNEAPVMGLASTLSNEYHTHSRDLLGPLPLPTAAHSTSPEEVQSFFSEESSRVKGHKSFRTRISNLRARIPSPYTSRLAANSNDSQTWEGHISPHAHSDDITRANVNSRQEDEYGMPIASLRHRKLRSKVSRWLRETGLAIRRGLKLHNSADVYCIPHR